MATLFILVFSCYLTFVIAADPLHPVRNLCKRWGHQSTYKNGKIYIDGGNEVFTSTNDDAGHSANDSIIGYNNYTLVLDTTRSWDWRTDQDIYTAFLKPVRTPQGNQIPVVQRGALFAGVTSDRSLYLYGGSYSSLNDSFPGATPRLARANSLFSFDPSTLAWGSITSQRMFESLAEIPNAGASVEAPDLGLAFYIGGQVDNGSSSDKYAMGTSTTILDGMIVIDMVNKTAQNYSTTSLGPPRTRGQATYVYNLGRSGALVYLGGLFQSAYNSTEYKKENLVSFETISFLDINLLFSNPSNLDPVWYQQNATGQIPPPRADFCMVSVSAADNSSHQIYIYGGHDGVTTYDDMYVLTMPSLTWFRMFEGTSPRFYHTCHVVAGNQLITLGGLTSEPGSTGFLNICDWEYQATAVYDLNTEDWGSFFNATTTPYLVSSNLSSFLGGNEYGGATVKAPTQGFADPQLARLFTEKRLANSTTPNGSDTGSGMKKSTLIGAIIGSILGGLLVLGVVYFMIHKYIIKPNRRRRKREKGITTHDRAYSEGNTFSDAASQSNTEDHVAKWRSGVTPGLQHHDHDIVMDNGQEIKSPNLNGTVLLEK